MIAFGVALALIVLAGVWAVSTNNGLVRGRNEVATAWADLDVELKRRLDLIPNLVESVKGYMTHERETLEAVVAARNAVYAARESGDRAETVAAGSAFLGALRQFTALVEAYPNLKANTVMADFVEELRHTENRLSSVRLRYNDAVNQQNNRVQMWPSSIIAGSRGFGIEPLFQLNETERATAAQAPAVTF